MRRAQYRTRGRGERKRKTGSVPSQREESLLNLDVALCRRLEEAETKLVRELLTLLLRDDLLVRPVALVSDEDLVDTFRGVLLDVRVPRPDVYAERRMSTTVERGISEEKVRQEGAIRNEQDALLKLLSSVTSYTRRIPIAPR
jgi:hypothetical protein